MARHCATQRDAAPACLRIDPPLARVRRAHDLHGVDEYGHGCGWRLCGLFRRLDAGHGQADAASRRAIHRSADAARYFLGFGLFFLLQVAGYVGVQADLFGNLARGALMMLAFIVAAFTMLRYRPGRTRA